MTVSNLAIMLTLVANGVLGFFWLQQRGKHVLHRSRVDAIALGVALLVNAAIVLPSPTTAVVRGWLAAAVVGGLLAAIANLIWSARERAGHVPSEQRHLHH